MSERKLFLHANDAHGILVEEYKDSVHINWFGKEYIFECPSYGFQFTDENILAWARKNCELSVDEFRVLGGGVLRNPFAGTLESYSVRGTNPRCYGLGTLPFSSMMEALIASPEDFLIRLTGSVLELEHNDAPAWVFCSLTLDQKIKVLEEYFSDLENISVLVRKDHNAPVVVGHHLSIDRMSEEIPHEHKVFSILSGKERK